MSSARPSPAKIKALRALHARRHGIRLRPDIREREIVLSEVHSVLRTRHQRGHVSIRAIAKYVSAHDRTVRRWLTGQHWPTEISIARMRSWLRTIEKNEK